MPTILNFFIFVYDWRWHRWSAVKSVEKSVVFFWASRWPAVAGHKLTFACHRQPNAVCRPDWSFERVILRCTGFRGPVLFFIYWIVKEIFGGSWQLWWRTLSSTSPRRPFSNHFRPSDRPKVSPLRPLTKQLLWNKNMENLPLILSWFQSWTQLASVVNMGRN